jgi:ribosomal protein L37AE/L43A
MSEKKQWIKHVQTVYGIDGSNVGATGYLCPECNSYHLGIPIFKDTAWSCQKCGWRPTDWLTELEERVEGIQKLSINDSIDVLQEAVLLLIKAVKEMGE